MKNGVFQWLMVAGGLGMVAGAALFFRFPLAARWLFAAAVACYAVSRLRDRYQGMDTGMRRLQTLLMLVMLLYAATAVLMFRDSRLWPVVLLAGAVADLYLIFRKAAVEKKHEP